MRAIKLVTLGICILFAGACGVSHRADSLTLSNQTIVNAQDKRGEAYTNNSPTGFVELEFLTESDWVGLEITRDNRRTVWKTTDRGKSWTKGVEDQNVVTGSSLNFVNKDLGFVLTENALLKTADGGLNWTLIHRFQNEDADILCFVNDKTGWVTGATWISGPTRDGDIGYVIRFYKTEDGGTSWVEQEIKDRKKITSNTGGKGVIHDIWFTDEKTGWAVGTGVVISTKDGGANWKYEKEITGLFEKIEFIDSQFGWMTERQLEESRFTIDGGKSWKFITFPSVVPSRGSQLTMNRYKQFIVAEPNGRIYLFDPLTGKTSEVLVGSEEWNRIPLTSFHNPYIGRTIDGEKIICMIFDEESKLFTSIQSRDEGRTWQ